MFTFRVGQSVATCLSLFWPSCCVDDNNCWRWRCQSAIVMPAEQKRNKSQRQPEECHAIITQTSVGCYSFDYYYLLLFFCFVLSLWPTDAMWFLINVWNAGKITRSHWKILIIIQTVLVFLFLVESPGTWLMNSSKSGDSTLVVVQSTRGYQQVLGASEAPTHAYCSDSRAGGRFPNSAAVQIVSSCKSLPL